MSVGQCRSRLGCCLLPLPDSGTMQRHVSCCKVLLSVLGPAQAGLLLLFYSAAMQRHVRCCMVVLSVWGSAEPGWTRRPPAAALQWARGGLHGVSVCVGQCRGRRTTVSCCCPTVRPHVKCCMVFLSV